MDFLYSLYDALVSINVPNDKARAVVDAMERDMGSTRATKMDLQLLRKDFLLLRKDLELLESRVVTRLGLLMTALFGIAGTIFAVLR
jgi:hypothetical protein